MDVNVLRSKFNAGFRYVLVASYDVDGCSRNQSVAFAHDYINALLRVRRLDRSGHNLRIIPLEEIL